MARRNKRTDSVTATRPATDQAAARLVMQPRSKLARVARDLTLTHLRRAGDLDAAMAEWLHGVQIAKATLAAWHARIAGVVARAEASTEVSDPGQVPAGGAVDQAPGAAAVDGTDQAPDPQANGGDHGDQD